MDPMQLKKVRSVSVNLLIMSLLLLVACGTEKGAKKAEEPQQALTEEEQSRQAWEEQLVDNPWMISSDYFRQKDDSDAINLKEWWEGRKKLEAKQEETEERLARLEKAAGKEQAAPQAQEKGATPQVVAAKPVPALQVSVKGGFSKSLRFKVALVILPEVYQASAHIKPKLLEAVRSEFAGHARVLLVGPDEVEDVLVQQGLDVSPKNMAKIARALGIYPAARLILFVDKVALRRDGKKVHGHLDYTMVDGFSGRSITQGEEKESASSGPGGEKALLQELLGRIALTVERKATKYAWLSRVAMVEGKRIYLSAGEASGLKPGDILAVYGPGREIIHPVAKVSMGFQRGDYKGKVKVLRLFGRDAAEATLVAAGQGKIEGNDLVALPDAAD